MYSIFLSIILGLLAPLGTKAGFPRRFCTAAGGGAIMPYGVFAMRPRQHETILPVLRSNKNQSAFVQLNPGRLNRIPAAQMAREVIRAAANPAGGGGRVREMIARFAAPRPWQPRPGRAPFPMPAPPQRAPMPPPKMPPERFKPPQPQVTPITAGAVQPSEAARLPQPQLPQAPLPGAAERLIEAQRQALLMKHQQDIIKVMTTNTEAFARAKERAGQKSMGQVEMDLYDGLHAMNLEAPRGKIFLNKVKDALTDKVILDKCTLEQGKVLGVGGTAVVVQMKVLEENAQKILGSTQFAAKIMFGSFPEPRLDEQRARKVVDLMVTLINQEVGPLREIKGKSLGGEAQTAKEISDANKWALPYFKGTLGSRGNALHIYNKTGFYSKAILSPVMLGDGRNLIKPGPSDMTTLPVAARELLVCQYMHAVARFNEAGMVHMDIKPDNMLIDPQGNAYLADFGMSGLSGETRYCFEKLTPIYMEPQQAVCALKNGHTTLSGKYDAWALGVTSYNMLTDGKFPFNIDQAREPVRYLGTLEPRSHLPAVPVKQKAAFQMERVQKELLAEGVSKLMATTVSRLLNTDRDGRITAQQAAEAIPQCPMTGEG